MKRKNKYGKIVPETAEKIKQDRLNGLSYKDISDKYGISKWWCIQHLRNIKPEKSWLEEKWKEAEKEAEKVLLDKGYTHIVNLNSVCPSPYWDYYAEKDGVRWLFDVTINQHKNLVDKGLHIVNGYSSAVLIKDKDVWKIMQINVREI